jgi:Methylamine utilisation protein MauE
VIDPDVGFLVVAAIGVLLASASWHKWSAPAEFEAVLANYRLLPAGLTPLFKWLVPAAEACVVAALVYGPTRRAAAGAGVLLLLGYAGAIAINLRRNRLDLDCGCGARNDRRPIAAWMVVRNLVLAAALATTAAPWTARALGAVDALTIAGGVAIAALIYLALDELLGQVLPRAARLRSPT